MQMLFQRGLNPDVPEDEVERYVHQQLDHPKLEEFCLELWRGCRAHLEEIDRRIADAAQNWRVERMAAVDRNVLRLAAFELLYRPDTPSNVVITEALEIVKRFSAQESSSFVNGILDRLAREIRGGSTVAGAPPSPDDAPPNNADVTSNHPDPAGAG